MVVGWQLWNKSDLFAFKYSKGETRNDLFGDIFALEFSFVGGNFDILRGVVDFGDYFSKAKGGLCAKSFEDGFKQGMIGAFWEVVICSFFAAIAKVYGGLYVEV